MSAVWVDEPPTSPSLLGMAGLAAFCELAIVRITMTIRANGPDTVEDKLRFLAGLRLRCVTFLTWRFGMFTLEPELAVAVMDKKQISFLPPPKRMTFSAIDRSWILVRIVMTIGASLKIQANIPGTLVNTAGAGLKVTLFTWYFAMFPIESKPRKIMIECSSIKPTNVTLPSKVFSMTIPAWTGERAMIADTIRHELVDLFMAFKTSF